MIKLKSIFSEHALFQAESRLTVKGKTDLKSELCLSITDESGNVAAFSKSMPSETGSFEIDIQTPSASDKTYTLTVSSETESVSFGDVLFGQLWFASGQSNMEMQNHYMEGWDSMKNRLETYGKMFRVYLQDWMGNLSLKGEAAAKASQKSKWTVYNWNGEFACDPEMPYYPVDDTHGIWLTCDKNGLEQIGNASALATSAMADLFDEFSRSGHSVPCGFLNVNVGGTDLEAWIPRENITGNKRLEEILEANGKTNDPACWNNCILPSYNQISALFNLKVSPCTGVRTAGVFWYQGENNNGTKPTYEFYRIGITEYYKAYKKLFSASDDFTLLCAQLYPFLYSEERVGIPHISKALADAAAEFPGKIAAVPVWDMKSFWNFSNHPLHPAHKYELGKRFAVLALRNRYGYEGIKSAAVPKSISFGAGKAVIEYDGFTGMLSLRSRNGFRIAGKDDKYYDAIPYILNNRLILSHPAVPEPVNCSFGYSDLDVTPSLFLDGIPVSCFSTDTDNVPQVQNRSWLFPEIESVSITTVINGAPDFYRRATWRPAGETEICRDNAFTDGICSLRLRNESGPAAAFVTAHAGARLDLGNYSHLLFEVIHNMPQKCTVTLNCENHVDIVLPARTVGKLSDNRDLMRVDFDIPKDFTDNTIKRMCFFFENENTFPLCTLAMENFILM